MIYIVTEESLKTTYKHKLFVMADEAAEVHSLKSLPHLPRIGEIVRLANEYEGFDQYPQYHEVTSVLHDIRDEDSDIYLVVKPYAI